MWTFTMLRGRYKETVNAGRWLASISYYADNYKRCYTAHSRGRLDGGGSQRGGSRWRALQWFGIPAGLGIACLALLQLQRTVRRERRHAGQRGQDWDSSWQLAMFQLIPARVLSRSWGRIMESEIPLWLRPPLLGLYVKTFGCKMEEALVEELQQYESFMALFTRELKDGVRPVSSKHSLVCPADGRVLHLGKVEENGRLEQIKGMTYPLHRFLGEKTLTTTLDLQQGAVQSLWGEEDRELFHVTIYLAPGDYHGFHSPADWIANTRRHFPGELLTVAPWAVRTMPGLFTLNERVLLLGQWEHGFFSLAAVGAYNVGSIVLTVDEEMKTNQKGCYVMGQFSDKALGEGPEGLQLQKGQKLGTFQMGSSIVLIFQAPRGFQFSVQPGDRVYYGQQLGHLRDR